MGQAQPIEKSANSTSLKATCRPWARRPHAKVGVSQRTGEYHRLLLLACAGIPGGEQLPGYLSRQVLSDPPHPRIVRGPRRSREPESRPGMEDEAIRLILGTPTGPYPGLPPSQNRFLDRPNLQRTRRTTCLGSL